jgi:glycosyltransferase involved in cell wall biosynthesis
LVCSPEDDSRSISRWWQWLTATPAPPAPVQTGRVLLISYLFPPTGGSGVQRPAKLAKYLPACGWSVEVLAAAHDRFPWSDPSLLIDLPPGVLVHRVAGWEPACLARRIALLCPLPGLHGRVEDALHWRLTHWADRLGLAGGESLWIGSAARTAVQLHRDKPFDAMISTGPPHFAHRVAQRVAAATGLPWLADLRDPMVSDFDRTQASPRHARRMQAFQDEVLDEADLVITTCPSFTAELQGRRPDRADRVRAITNGFDPEDIAQAIDVSELASTSRGDCVFVAAGSFYGRRELSRIINPLRQVLEANPQWRHRVQLVISGTIDAEQRRELESSRPEWVTLTGYVDHTRAIRMAARAACNIVVVPGCEHGRLSIPGKTFELMAVPTHMLALVPAGSDTEAIVTRAGDCTAAPFENEHAVASAMQQIIENRFADRLPAGRDWRRVSAFDRRTIAARFADCLNRLRETSTGSPSPMEVA